MDAPNGLTWRVRELEEWKIKSERRRAGQPMARGTGRNRGREREREKRKGREKDSDDVKGNGLHAGRMPPLRKLYSFV